MFTKAVQPIVFIEQIHDIMNLKKFEEEHISNNCKVIESFFYRALYKRIYISTTVFIVLSRCALIKNKVFIQNKRKINLNLVKSYTHIYIYIPLYNL